jgi:hypothetical protein
MHILTQVHISVYQDLSTGFNKVEGDSRQHRLLYSQHVTTFCLCAKSSSDFSIFPTKTIFLTQCNPITIHPRPRGLIFCRELISFMICPYMQTVGSA